MVNTAVLVGSTTIAGGIGAFVVMVLLIALIVTIALIGIFGYTVLDAINIFNTCGPIEKYIKSILAAICFPIYWIFRKKITNKYGCNINSGRVVNIDGDDIENLLIPPPV